MLADEVEAEEIALILDAAQVVGLHPALLMAGTAELLVCKSHLVGVEHRPADRLEKLEIRHAGAEPAKGDRRIQITPVEPDPVLEPLSKFSNAVFSGFSKDVPRYCSIAFWATNNALTSPSDTSIPGEARDRFGVNGAEMELIVFDRKAEPVAHEVDVALDGFGRNLQFVGQLAAIRERSGPELFMESQHPLQWRPGVEVAARLV